MMLCTGMFELLASNISNIRMILVLQMVCITCNLKL